MKHMQALIPTVVSLALCLSLAPQATAQGGPGSHIFYSDGGNGDDEIIHIYSSNGVWHYENVSVATGATGTNALPFAGQTFVAFHDSLGEHLFYIYACTCGNAVIQLYWQASTASWQPYQILTNGAVQPESSTNGNLTGFADSLGEHVFYTGADQHIHQLYGHNGWTNQDLTSTTPGAVALEVGSALTSFADSLGEHVFYEDANQHIHQLYGHNGWVDQDMTNIAGAGPEAMTAMTSFADSLGEHFFFVGTDGNIYQLYGHNTWIVQNLTPFYTNTVAPDTLLSSFSDGVGEHVSYFNPNTEIPNYDVMELCGCNGAWTVTDLTETTGGYPHQAWGNQSGLASFSSGTGSGIIEQVAYMGIYQPGNLREDVYVEWWNSSGGWHFEDLNVVTGAPSSTTTFPNAGLTAFNQ